MAIGGVFVYKENKMINSNETNTRFFFEFVLVILTWRAIWGIADWLFLNSISPADYVITLIIFFTYILKSKRKIGY